MNSDKLVILERNAFSLLKSTFPFTETNRKKALDLLFSDEYFPNKAEILRSIDKFYEMVNVRTLKNNVTQSLLELKDRLLNLETERLQNLKSLRSNEYLLNFMIDAVPGMVAYWTNELHCKIANNKYLEWFGKTKEQMKVQFMQVLLNQNF